jgi:ABC-type Mn2+/Zn2+ transport system ATPase subunit
VELLQMKGLVVGYQKGRPLLPAIDFTVRQGDIVGILGPNGSGKSTLLKTTLRLIPPLTGEIGFPLGRPPRVGYVPQGHRPDCAYPLSALQVTVMGRYGLVGPGRFAKQKDRDVALAQLRAVGLERVADSPFRSLSGGQRQRILVARALASEPELLILDEPTSEMDPAAEHALLSLVSGLVQERKVAVLFVTHEISAAAGFATKVMLLDGQQKYFEAGPSAEMISSARMSKLYGRPVEVRHEDGRTLVWLSAHENAAPAAAPAGGAP